MKNRFLWIAPAVIIGILSASCGPRLSKDQYVNAMTEVGCKGLGENSPGVAEIYKGQAVSQGDIDEFRKKGGRDALMAAAMTIATNVARCHGVSQ